MDVNELRCEYDQLHHIFDTNDTSYFLIFQICI